MNEVGDDGPKCSLISYVVPPGLSRAPVIGPADYAPRFDRIEAVSARPLSVPHNQSRPSTVAPSSPPLSPIAERPAQPVQQAKTSLTSNPEQTVSKPPKKQHAETAEEAQSSQPRKSCLTRAQQQAVVPARLHLKKKTVAFGKTVNVSQTIEGTSRASKRRQTMNRGPSAKEDVAVNTENKENEHEEAPNDKDEDSSAIMDILKDVKASLDALKTRDEERASELRSIRRLVDDRGREVDILRGMFADYLGKDYTPSYDSKQSSSTRKSGKEEAISAPSARAYERNVRDQSPPQRRYQRPSSPPQRNTASTGTRQESDPEEVDGVTFEEFRRLLATNAALRQFVNDIRKEDNDQRTGYVDRRRKLIRAGSPRWRDSPRRTERVATTAQQDTANRTEETRRREGRGAKFTEKVTVERSIRCSPPELAHYSVDTRRYLEDQILDGEGGDVQSIYRPGESVSYYPDRIRNRGYAGDMPDSDVEEEHDVRNYHDHVAVEERRRLRKDRRAERYQDY